MNQLIEIQNFKIETLKNSLNSEDYATILRESHSVFTTFLKPISKAGLLEHLFRLENNASTMDISFPWDIQTLTQWLLNWLETETLAIKNTDNVVRLSVFDDSELIKAGQILISTRSAPEKKVQRLRLKSITYEKPFPTVKYGRLSKPFALRANVQNQGFDDALWVNSQGKITESTVANIWGISNGTLYTPDSVKDGCLAGISREVILKHAKATGIPTSVASISLKQAKSMDALFLSNAVIGLQKVQSLDEVYFTWNEASDALYQKIEKAL